jgi:23S rRNA pseudouridine1911/1915/1917 synthase
MSKKPFLFEILHENEDFLVVHKPSGLVCHPTKGGAFTSLIGRLRLYLGIKSSIHIVNRLDRETSGVTLVAKCKLSARELGILWENRQVSKEYLAVVHGHVEECEQVIDAAIGKDVGSKTAIRDWVQPDGSASKTRFVAVKKFERNGTPFSVLRVWPETGRKHQIRIHLSYLGCPIVGDKLYGLDPGAYLDFVSDQLKPEQRENLILPWHALHARRISFDWKGSNLEFENPPEDWLLRFYSADGSLRRGAASLSDQS